MRILVTSGRATKAQCEAGSPGCRSDQETQGLKLYRHHYAALAELRHGRRDRAYRRFQEAYRAEVDQPLLFEVQVVNLPLWTLAARAATDTSGLRQWTALLRRSRGENADSLMASAVQAALDGDVESSLEELQRAFHALHLKLLRPMLSWYQLVDLCERLHAETGDGRYLDKALAWARMHQRAQPLHAWAYAFAARYSPDAEERVRAAAFAGYLDPRSHWLSQVPASIREQGKAWWVEHNPFVLEGA